MDRDDVHATVSDLITRLAPDVADDVPLAGSFAVLGMDSMTMIDLMVATEREFNIEIPDGGLASITTVEELVDFIVDFTRTRK